MSSAASALGEDLAGPRLRSLPAAGRASRPPGAEEYLKENTHRGKQHRTKERIPAQHPHDGWRHELPVHQFLTWEEKRIGLAEAALEAPVAPGREETTVTDLLPTQAATADGMRGGFPENDDLPLHAELDYY